MSEFKGTKGHWNLGHNVVKVNEHSMMFLSVYRTIVTNKIVAVVYSENNIEQEVRANAKLISKAPEMLQMLNKCADYFLNIPNNIQAEENAEAILQLIKECTEL
ncbi:hypothetical protein J2O09_05520 [Elizabethkingia anophelis]|uniref:hypothetical protein n=1 Tax=Elizabethkingia anophelis TaxID=1117645 RepID=UPI0020B84511|nr:hypothetical protein [Elizabethkingia anophelis]UTG62415.1 hypothetical protein J2O09_05520 [Elizabethkingia anophelis]UXM68697.1 hypothetical protein N7E57_05530 [Elizabethkingia anophelis]